MIVYENGIRFNVGLVEITENAVWLVKFMAEETVSEVFKSTLWIGGMLVFK